MRVDAHLAALRDLPRQAETASIRSVPGAFLAPARFESPRGAALPDPALEALRLALGRGFPHTALFDGGVYDAAGACVIEAVHHSARRRGLPHAREAAPPKAETLPGTWLYAGAIHNHIGHVLTEDLGRLWALAAMPAGLAGMVWQPVGASVFLAMPEGGRFPPGSVQGQLLALLGAGEVAQRVLTAPTRVERLLVPSQLMALDKGPLLAGRPLLRRFLRARLPGGQAGPPPRPHRLYVSRAGLDPFAGGQILGEAWLEETFAALGWEVMRPEARPLAAQLEAYARASHVVFAEGSATHVFALVARPDQEAVILPRRMGSRGHQVAQLAALGLARAEAWPLLAGLLCDADPPRPEARFPHPRRRAELGVLDLAALGARLEAARFVPPGTWPRPDPAWLAAEEARLHVLAAARTPPLRLQRVALDPHGGEELPEAEG
ncbi:MAG: glycosyltransferase family 61 protein [Rubritepida sp.]|nr:glycosyltransferase family 61 protein [Rubritepida sp.]